MGIIVAKISVEMRKKLFGLTSIISDMPIYRFGGLTSKDTSNLRIRLHEVLDLIDIGGLVFTSLIITCWSIFHGDIFFWKKIGGSHSFLVEYNVLNDMVCLDAYLKCQSVWIFGQCLGTCWNSKTTLIMILPELSVYCEF